jgi:hypothetical protein
MKERLIARVAQRTGLDAEKAGSAVDVVLEYLKENPTEMKELVGVEAGADIRERIGEAREKIAPVAEKGKEALGDAREKIGPVAAKAGERLGDVSSKARGRFRDLMKRDKDGAAEPADNSEAPAAGEEPASTER